MPERDVELAEIEAELYHLTEWLVDDGWTDAAILEFVSETLADARQDA